MTATLGIPACTIITLSKQLAVAHPWRWWQHQPACSSGSLQQRHHQCVECRVPGCT
jgi:hypothetical protein